MIVLMVVANGIHHGSTLRQRCPHALQSYKPSEPREGEPRQPNKAY